MPLMKGLLGDQKSPTTSRIDTDDSRMIAATASKPRPWTMTITLRDRPRCFGCGGSMLPKVVRIQRNFAVCDVCDRIDWHESHPYWSAIDSLGGPLELTTSRGIVYWTPPASLPVIDAYLRWMELWDIMKSAPTTRRPHLASSDISQ